MINTSSIELFFSKVFEVYKKHELNVNRDVFTFSNLAIENAKLGDWNLCCQELCDILSTSLANILSDNHFFEKRPYVRNIQLTGKETIRIAIINQQGASWYGTENTIAAFDFLLEARRGVFKDSYSFLDLGGHQLVWSVYYAKTSDITSVIAFEPSILNTVIGLFNCLINGVINRVSVIPFAISVTTSFDKNDGDKMLVDFMKVPLRTCHINECLDGVFDFIKTDIEGYEYELLGNKKFIHLIKNSKNSHFELHLGHLVKRGILLNDCVLALKSAGLNGVELYSGTDMYDFLKSCNPNGFFSFLIS